MKITDVKATPVNVIPSRKFLDVIVEIETDEGITGIGEAAGCSLPGYVALGVKAYIEKGLKQVLIGQDPTDYRPLFDKMQEFDWMSANGVGASAVAGVDIALIDLAGKAKSIPACKLLGGCYRTKVRVYASHPVINPKDIKVTIKEAQSLIEQSGYTSTKLSCSWYPLGQDLEKDKRYFKEVRDALGWDIDLAISENAPNRGAQKAINIGKVLEPFNLIFWEDALPRGDIMGHIELSNAVDVPIEAGEEMTDQMIKLYIFKRAVDALNPEVNQLGLSVTKKLADLAYAAGIKTYPHNHGTAISVAATVQLTASMPDGELMEYRTSDPDASLLELLEEPMLPKKGYIDVPQKPGLGVELDRKVLKRLTWNG